MLGSSQDMNREQVEDIDLSQQLVTNIYIKQNVKRIEHDIYSDAYCADYIVKQIQWMKWMKFVFIVFYKFY